MIDYLVCNYQLCTYTINSVNERIVATITHCQPMATKKYDVDVAISENRKSTE